MEKSKLMHDIHAVITNLKIPDKETTKEEMKENLKKTRKLIKLTKKLIVSKDGKTSIGTYAKPIKKLLDQYEKHCKAQEKMI